MFWAQIFLIIISITTGGNTCFAGETDQKFVLKGEEWNYSPPDYWSVLTNIPSTSIEALKVSFSKEAILPWAVIISSTAVLYHNDEEILLNVQRFGRHAGIGNQENTRTIIRGFGVPLFRAPTDLGSLLYFIGDGWTHAGLTIGFFTYGQMHKDYRALQTSLQLVHGMIVSTLFSQALKRSTGRESPIVRTSPLGEWRPFPSIKEYGLHTSKYDAFPSGHIMTATLSLVVISENYPEYTWIKPLGWTLVGLLGFEMVNNSVHWASDYPLGIAMGLLFGKLVLQNGREKVGGSGSDTQAKFQILPMLEPDTLGVQAVYLF